MHKPFLCILFYIILIIFIVGATDYCNICKNKSHTMCKYPTSGPSNSCKNYSFQEMTIKSKKLIVRLHNNLRSKVAVGLESRGKMGGQPPAVNMLLMKWDDELAIIAQRWADQCRTMAEPNQHDECKRTDRFEVGQNVIGAIKGRGDINFDKLIQEMIMQWYKEVERVSPEDVNKFKESTRPSKEIGHYSQIVWASSQYIGCGFVRFVEEIKQIGVFANQTINRLVCNYGPTGNVLDTAIYKIGKPCSECKCGNKEFPALCAASDENGEEKYNPTTTVHINEYDSAFHYDKEYFDYPQEKEEDTTVIVKQTSKYDTKEVANIKNKYNNAIPRPSFFNLSQTLYEITEMVKRFNFSRKTYVPADSHKLLDKFKITKMKDEKIKRKSTQPINRRNENNHKSKQDWESDITSKLSSREPCKYNQPPLQYIYGHREGDACYCWYKIRSSSYKFLGQTYLLLILLFLYYSIFW